MLSIYRQTLPELKGKSLRVDLWMGEDAQILDINQHPQPPYCPVLWTLQETKALGQKRSLLFVYMAFGNLDFLARDATEATMMHIKCYQQLTPEVSAVYNVFEIPITMPVPEEIDQLGRERMRANKNRGKGYVDRYKPLEVVDDGGNMGRGPERVES